MMAAGRAAQAGHRVALVEKMERPGRKLRITGKGRCNLTNAKPWDAFKTHVYPTERVFRPAFFAFDNRALYAFIEGLGLPLQVQRGDRVFPQSERAQDVVDALQAWLGRCGVSLLTGAEADSWVVEEGRPAGLTLRDGRTLRARAFVLATGGLSYPATGSTGEGYRLAALLGHSLPKLYPGLCVLRPRHYDSRLPGISLKNVGLALYCEGKLRQEDFGELTFMEGGIEGPLGLRLSREAVLALEKGGRAALHLNLKPALSTAQLAARWEKEAPAQRVERLLEGYLPQALIPPFMAYAGLTPGQKKQDLSPARSRALMEAFHTWVFPLESHGGYERAVITLGGISWKEVKYKTLQSQKAENLFFAGEILDLDADTGGYNLQIAFSTGHLAGTSVAAYLGKGAE